MEHLEAKYVRIISRAAAILESAKLGLKCSDSYTIGDHIRILDSVSKDAAEITKASV